MSDPSSSSSSSSDGSSSHDSSSEEEEEALHHSTRRVVFKDPEINEIYDEFMAKLDKFERVESIALLDPSKSLRLDSNERPSLRYLYEGEGFITTDHLEEDTFSFLISAPVFSVPFFTGLLVLCLENLIIILILYNMIDRTSESNPLGIPSSVSEQVAVAQFVAISLALTTQDDIRTALKKFTRGLHAMEGGITEAFPDATTAKWVCSIAFQFIQGMMAIVVTFLLIITTDVVIDLLLNFTAMEFVAVLDNVTFSIALQGFIGIHNKHEAERIVNTEFKTPHKDERIESRLQIITVVLMMISMMAGYIWVYAQQLAGRYTTQTFYAQFDDAASFALGAYSGLYTIKIAPRRLGIGRLRYVSENGDEFFAYCEDTKRWTFSAEGDDACSNPILVSPYTRSYDINTVADSTWSVTTDPSSKLYFPIDDFSLLAGCVKDEDCAGTHGKCVNNKCECEEHFYGARCHFSTKQTCENVAINSVFSGFSGSVVYAEEYQLLRLNGTIVQAYHHPVYYNYNNNGGLDVMIFMGFRWGLTSSARGFPGLGSHTPEALARYLNDGFHAAKQLRELEFVTDGVLFNSPDDLEAPFNPSWWLVQVTDLANTKLVGQVNTRLICSVCSEANPCQFDNVCEPNRVCRCENGATGRLCQIAPLSNGICDAYFNVGSYDYDGGDCCQATCSNTGQNTCGIIDSERIERARFDFPLCKDPKVLSRQSSVWIPNSNPLQLLASNHPPLLTLSANGRVMVVSEPLVDVVRVFDLEDSTWRQRGLALSGSSGSNFGKVVALHTPPSYVVGHRTGKIPILLAIFEVTGMRVVRWESNDFAWRSSGFAELGCVSECTDVRAAYLARKGKRVSLLVQNGSSSKIYRTTLVETGQQVWADDGYTFYDTAGGITGLPSHYLCGAPGGVAMTEDGSYVIHSTCVSDKLNVYAITDDGDQGDDSIAVVYALGTIPFKSIASLPYSEMREHVEEVITSIQGMRVVSLASSLFVLARSQTFEYWFRYQYDVLDGAAFRFADIVKYPRDALRQSGVDVGLWLRFSSDGISYAYRVNSTSVAVKSFDHSEASYREKGTVSVDEGQDFVVAEDGRIIEYAHQGSLYGLDATCQGVTYQVSITFDDFPEGVTLVVGKYLYLGALPVQEDVLFNCASCFGDKDTFGRTVVSRKFCVAPREESCTRMWFRARTSLTSGAGMKLFRDGTEIMTTEYEQSGAIDTVVNFGEGNTTCEKLVKEMPCTESESLVVLEVHFGSRPQTISWMLQDQALNVLSQGGSYTFQSHAGNMKLFQTCGPRNQNYTFSMQSEIVVDTTTDADTQGFSSDIFHWVGYRMYVDGVLVFTREGEGSFESHGFIFDHENIVAAGSIPLELRLGGFQYPDEVSVEIMDSNSTIVYYKPSLDTVNTGIYLEEGMRYRLVLRDGFGNDVLESEASTVDLTSPEGITELIDPRRPEFQYGGKQLLWAFDVPDLFPLTLELQLDGDPEETSFKIGDKTFGPFSSSLANGKVYEVIHVRKREYLSLDIYDSGRNGFCCDNGNGLFSAYAGTVPDADNLLVQGWGLFEDTMSVGFRHDSGFCPVPMEVPRVINVSITMQLDDCVRHSILLIENERGTRRKGPFTASSGNELSVTTSLASDESYLFRFINDDEWRDSHGCSSSDYSFHEVSGTGSSLLVKEDTAVFMPIRGRFEAPASSNDFYYEAEIYVSLTADSISFPQREFSSSGIDESVSECLSSPPSSSPSASLTKFVASAEPSAQTPAPTPSPTSEPPISRLDMTPAPSWSPLWDTSAWEPSAWVTGIITTPTSLPDPKAPNTTSSPPSVVMPSSKPTLAILNENFVVTVSDGNVEIINVTGQNVEVNSTAPPSAPSLSTQDKLTSESPSQNATIAYNLTDQYQSANVTVNVTSNSSMTPPLTFGNGTIVGNSTIEASSLVYNATPETSPSAGNVAVEEVITELPPDISGSNETT